MQTKSILALMFFGSIIANLNGFDKAEVLNKLIHYQGPRTYLLSYPRSGNTWIRYCLEFLTRRATITYQVGINDLMNQPLAWRAGFELDLDSPPIEKVHNKLEMERGGELDPDQEHLILIVRNPKEAITRHEKHTPNLEIFQGVSSDQWYKAPQYFENIRLYGQWNPSKRILIFYEDLLVNPRQTLENLLTFLQVPFTYIDEFFSKYDYHKNKALTLYASATESKGADLYYHSKKMSQEERLYIDGLMEELFPDVWHGYLKNKYSEKVLIEQGAYQ